MSENKSEPTPESATHPPPPQWVLEALQLRREKRYVELAQHPLWLKHTRLSDLQGLLGWFERNREKVSPQDWETATTSVRQALQTEARQFQLAWLYQRSGDLEKAIEVFTEILRRNPQSADAYRERGICRKELEQEQEDYQEGFWDDLHKAAELEEENPDNHEAIVDALLDLHDFFSQGQTQNNADYCEELLEQAIQRCRIGLRADPEHARLYRKRAEAYLRQGRNAPAVADLDKAIELEPACVEYYLARAKAKRSGSTDEALRDYSKAIELDPACSEALIERAGLILEVRAGSEGLPDVDRVEKALPDLEKAIELSHRPGTTTVSAHTSKSELVETLVALVRKSALAIRERAERHLASGDGEKALADGSRVMDLVNQVHPHLHDDDILPWAVNLLAKASSSRKNPVPAVLAKTSWPVQVEAPTDRPLFSGDGPCPNCKTMLWIDWKLTFDTMTCPGCGFEFDGEAALSIVTSHKPSKNSEDFGQVWELIKRKKELVILGQQMTALPASPEQPPLASPPEQPSRQSVVAAISSTPHANVPAHNPPTPPAPPPVRLEDAPVITSGLSVEMVPQWKFLDDYGLKHLLGFKDSGYYEQKGHMHYVQQQYDKAIDCYSMAIRQAAGTWHPFLYYQHRARARMAQGRFQEALADFSEAVRLDSSGFMAARHMAHRIRGDIEAMQGRYEEAVRYYSASLDLQLFASEEQDKRDKAECLNNRGIALLALARPEEALRDLSQAVEICPRYKALYTNRAYAYRLLGDAAAASQDEEQAIRVEQQQPTPQQPVDVSAVGNLLGSLFALIWYWKCPNCGQRSGEKVGTESLGDGEQRVETRYDLHTKLFRQMVVDVWTVRLYFRCKKCHHQWTELEVRSAIA
jgi:tetratricopeptide (TPR) repeat protein